VELSSRGGGVHTAKLAQYFATVGDKQRYKEDPETYRQAVRENPQKYRGHYSLLNPVGERLPMATGWIQVQAEDWDAPLATDLARVYWQPVTAETQETDGAVSASFAVRLYAGTNAANAMGNPLVRIVKTYTVRKDDYSLAISLRLESLTGQPLVVTFDQAGPTGVPREDLRTDMRQAAYAHLQSSDGRAQNRLKPAKELPGMPLDKPVWLGASDDKDPVLWVGQVNKFFGSMMYLQPAVAERLAASTWGAEFYVEAGEESPTSRTFLTGLRVPSLLLKPEQDQELNFDVFIGPKKRELFTNPQNRYHKPLYSQLGYIGTIDFGGCFCTFGWLSLAMMWLLEMFSKVALGNYGVAIILLVLLVRLVLHPLTKKSQVSMMRMQKLAPQMQKLKEKYADDKGALNKEMMKLYKEQGAGPLLGCLPMFLQMPILLALYSGLNAAVELRHAAFLPVWITDLAAPDQLFTWSANLPVLGHSFNLLPILLAVAMFLQTKYSPQSAQPAASEQAQQQQKMMKYMMPAMMLLIFYNMASGLNLYFMASTFAGLLDQYFVRRHIQSKEAEEAALQTTVRVPGKALRGKRPKKPKGPFWIKRG